jgi:COP9 signalosome complex subunit 1
VLLSSARPLLRNLSRQNKFPFPSSCSLASRLRAASGLKALSEGQYETAAREFLTLPLRFGDSFNSVLHVEEAALYGGICALATFSREDLRAIVLGGSSSGSRDYSEEVISAMRSMLSENAPVMLKEALSGFVTSKYASCLENLNTMQSEHLSLDYFLGPHVTTLITAIRKRALKQYLLPYCNVDLNTMAKAFQVPVASLEQEISELISASPGGLEARLHIEGENRMVLQAYSPDPRALALQRSLETANEFASDAKQLLLKASMELEGVYVGASGTTSGAAGGSGAGESSQHPVAAAAVGVGGGAAGGHPSSISSSSAIPAGFADRELLESLQAEARRHGVTM